MGARGWAPLSCRGPSRLPRPPPSSGSTGTPQLPRTDSQLRRSLRRARHPGPAPVPPNPRPRGPLAEAAKPCRIGRSGPSFVYPLRIPCGKCASTWSNGSILFFNPRNNSLSKRLCPLNFSSVPYVSVRFLFPCFSLPFRFLFSPLSELSPTRT